MRYWAGSLTTMSKIALLAVAVVVATFSLGRGASPVHASQGEIIFSYSNATPVSTAAIVLYPGAPPSTIYVWAKDVGTGQNSASAFQMHFFFNPGVFTIDSFVAHTDWLGSSGRNVNCPVPAEITSSEAHLGCSTPGQVPPFGATGSGLIGEMELSGITEAPAGAVIDASNSALTNTPSDPDNFDFLDITISNPSVSILKCADFSGDGRVTLALDILAVILRWGMTTAHPDWDPKYDLNESGNIDLSGDILGSILQYQLECTQE